MGGTFHVARTDRQPVRRLDRFAEQAPPT